jgi:hypothetical protein
MRKGNFVCAGGDEARRGVGVYSILHRNTSPLGALQPKLATSPLRHLKTPPHFLNRSACFPKGGKWWAKKRGKVTVVHLKDAP